LCKRIDQEIVGLQVEFGLEVAAGLLAVARRQIAGERSGGNHGGNLAAGAAQRLYCGRSSGAAKIIAPRPGFQIFIQSELIAHDFLPNAAVARITL
jgi:hypothetical protein